MTEVPKILLIDDDEDDQVLVYDMLCESFGEKLKLDWVSAWDEGIEAIGSDIYDVYLVDYRLGERDGLGLIRQAVAQNCTAPSILLTGEGNREIDLSAAEAGAADYLVKGQITAPLLERAIRYAIARQAFLKAQIEANELLRKKNLRLSELYNTAHQIVDNFSHEFRTPLTVIKEYISILQDGLAGDLNDQQKEYLGIAIERVDDLSLMVNDMLDISRLEIGLLGICRDECRIKDIVERVRPTLERKALSRNVLLDIAIQDGLPNVYCDIEKIGRVIINLAVNAIKFCGDEGRTKLWARPGADTSEIIFGITDNGPGIAPEDVQQIFERFKQMGANVTASTKGFGLGLNIAKELVQLNFGDIAVESTPGEGSTFTFSVPVYDPPRILERFLRRIEQLRDGSCYVTLISAHVEPMVDPDLLENVGQFLQHQVRRSDLLFFRQPSSWLLVAAANRQELDPLLRRIAKARVDTNRNRVGEELPEIEFEDLGTWRSADQAEEFIRNFKTEFDTTAKSRPERGETAHVTPA